MKTYQEQPRPIPVYGEYDVLVAGGGTAGVFSALAAARTGAKTLVLERLDCLGGLLTAGMMSATVGMNDMEKMVLRGIPLEFFTKLDKRGGIVPSDLTLEAFTFFDSEMAKEVIVEMVRAEPNLEVLYYTWVADAIMEGDALRGLVIENKSGRQAVYARCVVDATGDADVCAFSGAKHFEPVPEQTHPVTLLAKVGGVDVGKLREYYAEHPDHKGSFTRNWPVTPFHTYRIDKELEGKPLPEHLEYLRDWFILFYETIRDGEIILNLSSDIEVDGTDASSISRAEDNSRIRVEQCIEVFRMYMPGCENMYLIQTGSTLGIRESRQLDGRYTVTLEDLLTHKEFPDTVARSCALVGNHTSDGTDSKFEDIVPGNPFSMPYGCMVPKNVEGLLVTGRCISVTREAMGGTRIMPVCMGLGHAAGTAAALSAKQGISPGDISIELLQKTLREQNAFLG